MAFFDVSPLPVSARQSPDFDPHAYVTERCKEFGVLPSELRGPRRYQRLVGVRTAIAMELRAQGLSLPEIGRAMGGRHHTTVMNLLGYFDHDEKKRRRR